MTDDVYSITLCQMCFILLIYLTLLPSATGYVDCRLACRTCREKKEHPSVLEVYCAMCKECKERRKARMQANVNVLAPPMEPAAKLDPLRQSRYQWHPPQFVDISIPEGCPTPPPCDESEPSMPLALEVTKTTSTTTMRTTTTTKPRPRCPAITPCTNQITRPTYIPCTQQNYQPGFYGIPVMPCPGFQYMPVSVPTVVTSMETVKLKATTKGYVYVYVGVPKDVLKKK